MKFMNLDGLKKFERSLKFCDEILISCSYYGNFFLWIYWLFFLCKLLVDNIDNLF